jgi:chromosome segregation ATPase
MMGAEIASFRADMDESGAFGSEGSAQQLHRRYSGHGLERFDESGARIYDEPTGTEAGAVSAEFRGESRPERPNYEKLAADRQYEIQKLNSRVSELESAQFERDRAVEEANNLRTQLHDLESRLGQPRAADTAFFAGDQEDYTKLRGKYDNKKADLKATKKELKTTRKSFENLENDNKMLHERIAELQTTSDELRDIRDENERLRSRLEGLEQVRAQHERLQSDMLVAQRRLAELEQSGSSSVTQS